MVHERSHVVHVLLLLLYCMAGWDTLLDAATHLVGWSSAQQDRAPLVEPLLLLLNAVEYNAGALHYDYADFVQLPQQTSDRPCGR